MTTLARMHSKPSSCRAITCFLCDFVSYKELVYNSVATTHRRATMSKDQDRTISRRADGTWENKRNDASRASSVHDTQAEAQKAAREMLKKQGGGELTTKGVDGRIRDKDTVAPGNDPSPPKG
ncbi:DUF2188 domain-containing protein [Pseudomonas sp. p106]|uniref:DUF2188 domain-containing protein n=1 Tax=Pseudomonas sp. p106 TaxID=2479854 RepID=UPI00273DBF9E|nr:DUF2188 domain-containing protein [Pseudomonas sp. p106]